MFDPRIYEIDPDEAAMVNDELLEVMAQNIMRQAAEEWQEIGNELVTAKFTNIIGREFADADPAEERRLLALYEG